MNTYSVKDLEELITKIQAVTGYTQAEIEQESGYNPGYVSQVKNKGKVPEKLVQTLQFRFQDQLFDSPRSEKSDGPPSRRRLDSKSSDRYLWGDDN